MEYLSMEQHFTIPDEDGLYSYVVDGKLPEPVLIHKARYGAGKFKGFNGRVQTWLRKGESLIGPIDLPNSLL
jgi:hypothetical protein